MKRTKTTLAAGAFAILSSCILSSCANMHPGGLSDQEWNSLSPARRAELTMQQQSLVEREVHDAQQNAHWNKEDSNSGNKWDNEARRDLNSSMKKYNYKP